MIADDDGVTGLGVAGLAALARADLERAEAPQLDDPVRQEAAFDLVEEKIDDLVDVLLADLDQGEDVFDYFGLGKLLPGHGADPARLSTR